VRKRGCRCQRIGCCHANPDVKGGHRYYVASSDSASVMIGERDIEHSGIIYKRPFFDDELTS
jgi:hypothetical protein